MLKKSVLAVVMLLLATNVWAVKTLEVSKTIHNLGSLNQYFPEYKATNEDEVCIFCHTPHGGTLDAPLWNRDLSFLNGGVGFTHYSSATLSGYMQGEATRPLNTESLLCLSCHDGTVAMGTIINISNRTGAVPDVVPMMDEIFPGMGTMVVGGATKDMTDDHPVSFSYYDAQAHIDNTGKLHPADGLANDPRLKGIRLFGADAQYGQRVECSSCHDPHVNSTPTGDENFAPFLVMSNSGSALCLACHIK